MDNLCCGQPYMGIEDLIDDARGSTLPSYSIFIGNTS